MTDPRREPSVNRPYPTGEINLDLAFFLEVLGFTALLWIVTFASVATWPLVYWVAPITVPTLTHPPLNPVTGAHAPDSLSAWTVAILYSVAIGVVAAVLSNRARMRRIWLIYPAVVLTGAALAHLVCWVLGYDFWMDTP
jgi:hypothetical protein